MSLNKKRYREVSRTYLLRIIERQKKDSTCYPASLYDNNLEICPKTFRCKYTPIFEYDNL